MFFSVPVQHWGGEYSRQNHFMLLPKLNWGFLLLSEWFSIGAVSILARISS